MKLRFVVFFLALGLLTVGAQAQVGVYFTGDVTRISNSTADTGAFAFLGEGKTSQIFGGVGFGAYYDFLHMPKYSVGADMRDVIEHGNNAALNSFLAGVRLSGRPEHSRFRPYVELAVGDGHTRSPYSPVHINKLEYDVFAGTDFRLGKHVDWRVAEIGYGAVQTISSAVYNSSETYPNARLLNFSSGFVLRFP